MIKMNEVEKLKSKLIKVPAWNDNIPAWMNRRNMEVAELHNNAIMMQISKIYLSQPKVKKPWYKRLF
jgi:hypothetical protein